jgi:hypothetical protein
MTPTQAARVAAVARPTDAERRRAGWWMGALFASGSTCFAVAAIASQWASAPRPAIGVTFFVGSILFTLAAALQYTQAVAAGGGEARRVGLRRFPVSFEPRRADWLAASIQFAGTLLFNVSTFEGMRRGFDTRETNLRVWAPDAFGSIAFLVASEIAFADACGGRWFCIRSHDSTWRIAAVNLLGWVAFGVSAIAALVEPSNAEPVSAAVSNAGTAVGALCFLAGGLLLMAAARRAPSHDPSIPEETQ